MVRTLIFEESLKCTLDDVTSGQTSCAVHLGFAHDDKKFIVEVFSVPIYDDIESDLENSLMQLILGLPGGCYPLGITTTSNEKILSFLNLIRKTILKIQKFSNIDGALLEPFVLYKSGNKFEAKVLVDGQMKPINTKIQSFFSTWHEVNSYLNVQRYIPLPKKTLKQSHSNVKSEISRLIYELRDCKMVIAGKTFKDDKSLFDDRKSKSPTGKSFSPKLILPMSKKPKKSSNATFFIGSIFTHVYISPKLRVEQVRDIILEDLARSIYARLDSLLSVADEGEERSLLEAATVPLPYRVTFPLGLVELSVYLLQDEDVSQAARVAGELFDLTPTSLKAHEGCSSREEGAEKEAVLEDDKDNQIRNVLVGVLCALLAFLVALVIAFQKAT